MKKRVGSYKPPRIYFFKFLHLIPNSALLIGLTPYGSMISELSVTEILPLPDRRSGNTQVFFNLTLSTTFHTWICLVLSGTCIGTYSCLYLDEKQSHLIGLCRL